MVMCKKPIRQAVKQSSESTTRKVHNSRFSHKFEVCKNKQVIRWFQIVMTAVEMLITFSEEL